MRIRRRHLLLLVRREDAFDEFAFVRLARLSSMHFNRRFQQLLRMTPTAYLRTVRIQAARRLLSITSRALAALAHDTGFTDQSTSPAASAKPPA